MKAEELMIGNFIESPFINNYVKPFVSDYVKVIGILLTYNEILKVQTKDNDGLLYYETIDKYKPILLTEEWLIRFGWMWNETCKSWENSDMRMNLQYRDLSESYTMFNYVLKSVICERIFYVHQLQNLYYTLTNEHLTIK